MTGAVVWFTGLPGAGKSTLARRVAARLREARREPVVLDGDDVRAVLVPRPGHDPEGRDGFYRTLAGLAALVARDGAIALVAATAHRQAWRAHARTLTPRFVEVYLATPLDECRRRDPKGLYAAAPADLPGVGVAYEPPTHAEVVVVPGREATAVDQILAHLAIGGIDP